MSPESIELVLLTSTTKSKQASPVLSCGFAHIALWSDLAFNIPPALKIPPLPVVQWMIFHLPFAVPKTGTNNRRLGDIVQKSVNDTTTFITQTQPETNSVRLSEGY